ncbi:hypothetical protein ABZS93_14005 [Streptomyces sp900116325]|uniref:hypothetical protein n=1 Tax=Streptomyces sp. 900116325 TaxID=3154295 RepID=UPI0033A35249
MLRNSPVRRFAVTTAAVAVLATPLTACDSKDQADKKTSAAPAPQTLCGIKLPEDAERALLDLLGAQKLDTSGSRSSVRDTAEALSAGRASGDNDYELCRAFGPSSETRSITFTFSTTDEVPKQPASQFTQYKMGAMALSRPRSALLFMKCSSDRFASGFDDPVVIRGELYNMMPTGKSNDTLTQENLNVLHAVSVGLARNLGCANNAHLSSEFSMPPKV